MQPFLDFVNRQIFTTPLDVWAMCFGSGCLVAFYVAFVFYHSGRFQGFEAGSSDGFEAGKKCGYASGFQEGWNACDLDAFHYSLSPERQAADTIDYERTRCREVNLD